MGNLQMVVRAHFRAFFLGFLFLFFFLVTKYSAMHDSCSFYFITTMLWVALDIGYISIAKSVVFFEVGNGEAHAYNTYREL